MAQLDTMGAPEAAENNSSKTVKFWLPQTKEGRGEYVGEIYVENGEFVAKGVTPEDTDWLNKKLANFWIPQRGIPVFKKHGEEFEKDQDNKYVIESYRSHGNCTADELVEAVYSYTAAMGVFKVALEVRSA